VGSTLDDLARQKRYDDVLRAFREHDDADIARVADLLREEDAYRAAIPLYAHRLEQGDDADAHFGLGQCAGKLYDYERALSHLRKAFASGRTDGANYYAYILERNGLTEEAEAWYDKALAAGYGDDLWTLSHRAAFLEKCGRAEQAEAAYRDVLERNAGYTWAVKRYALFLLRQGRAEESRALMDATAQRMPASPYVKMNELEYRILRGGGEEYETFRAQLDYEALPPELQVLVDLFDYVERDLRHGRSDAGKVRALEERAATLTDSVHRDIDDLTELLAACGADLQEWQRLVDLLLK
jgi:Flp pilus assembly protein TadD